ncbi:MAG: cyclase [Pseudohongiellaceae bacterium]|jgi:cyclase
MFKKLTMALLCTPIFVSAQTDFDEIEITVNEVTNGIYMLEGSGGNIGLSVGEDGVFIIDDQFGPLTQKIKTAIAAYSNDDVQFVFNTHFHYDHSDGNENFGAGGAVIIAQDNARMRMTEDNFLQVVNVQQNAYNADGLPKITFTDSMTLHYNGHTLQAMHFGSGHTDGDTILKFEEANVIHTGDVFVRYGLPFIDVPNGGNLNGIIRVMHGAIAMADADTKVIPGHGQLSGRQDMLDYVEMLETIRDRVYEGIKAGLTLEQITATNPVRGYPEGFLNNESFSKIAYDSFF